MNRAPSPPPPSASEERARSRPNPWLHRTGLLAGSQTATAEDRIYQIKQSTDPRWLRSVLAWADNQLTVRQAAARRLRALTHRSTPHLK